MADKRKRKLGWFGWTFMIVLFITIAGSVLIFTNLFNLDIDEILNRQASTDSEEISEEAQHEIEEIQNTVGQDHTELGDFINNKHDFYNETTGYGGINNLDWSEQKEAAGEIIDYIDENIDSVTDESLTNDLNAISDLASNVLEVEEAEHVRDLHRFFHDLDIALNSYNAYDRIWNVTETLKTSG